MSEISEEFIPLTQVIIDELKLYKTNTGMGPSAILRGRGDEKPQGLNYSIVTRWINGTSKQAKREYLDYMRAIWSDQASAHNARVEVAPYMAKIKQHRLRTGCGSRAVLKGREDIPDGLKFATIDSWISLTAKVAKRQYLDYVLQCYQDLESVDPKASSSKFEAYARTRRGEDYCKIDVSLTQHHFERTGVPNSYFLNCPDAPDRLNSSTIHRLRSGKNAKMHRESYDFILEKLVNAPDRVVSSATLVGSEDSRKGLRDGYTLIPDDTMATLGEYHKLGFLPSKIFKYTPFRPENPKPHTITGWLNGKTRTAKMDDLEFVLRLCETVAEEC